MIVLRQIPWLVLGGIHVFFLLNLMEHDATPVWVKWLVLPTIALLLIGYLSLPTTKKTHSKTETLITPFAVCAAGLLTYFLGIELTFGPVIAAAGIGFLASYLPTFFKARSLANLPAPIYCGTFVGMCGTYLTESYFFIAYAGLCAGVLYLMSRDGFNGIGGKYGSLAFGGIVLATLIFGEL